MTMDENKNEDWLVAEFDAIAEDGGDFADAGDFNEDSAEDEDYECEEAAAMWGGGAERAEEREREAEVDIVAIPREILADYDLPKLPAGVAIVGGTARGVAREILAGTSEPVRALELAFFPELIGEGEDDPGETELEELAKKFMPEDYVFGRGVRREQRIAEYFLARDFTVDQCVVHEGKLILTRAAAEDLQNGIIRPAYAAQPGAATPTSERMLMRALLMEATLEAGDADVRLEDFALEEIEAKIDERREKGEDLRLDAFTIALALNKAMSRGAEVAMEIVDIFVEYGIVDEFYEEKPLNLARRTRDAGAKFEFRALEGCPDEDTEYEFKEEFMDFAKSPIAARTSKKQKDFAGKAGSRRGAKGSADATGFADFSGFAGVAEMGIEEIAAGEYAADDYDWVNRTGAYATRAQKK